MPLHSSDQRCKYEIPIGKVMSCTLDSLIDRREAHKEKDLIEKKLSRMEAARSVDINGLQADLEATKSSMRDQLNKKDVKINGLIEELGNTQAMLSDKSHELDQVQLLLAVPLRSKSLYAACLPLFEEPPALSCECIISSLTCERKYMF